MMQSAGSIAAVRGWGDVTAASRGAAQEGLARGRLVMKGVSKRFANTVVAALEDINLAVEPGEFVVVVGPSGCGKSTLLNIAAGMLRADGGTVMLDGHPVDSPGPDRAMVFQDHGLFPWLNVSQNISFGLRMSGATREQRDERVEEVLKLIQMVGCARKLVHELSGGMKQRVAIARALVMDPALLMMDEPFASLDAQTRTLLHQQLQEMWLATRKTILFVTHSVGEAVRLADRIIVLHAHPGRIRKEIRVALPHPRKFDSADINELAKQVRGEIEEEVNRVNREMAGDEWQPKASGDVGADLVDMGGGI